MVQGISRLLRYLGPPWSMIPLAFALYIPIYVTLRLPEGTSHPPNPPTHSIPVAGSFSLRLEDATLIPTSGPLYMLSLLPGIFSAQNGRGGAIFLSQSLLRSHLLREVFPAHLI